MRRHLCEEGASTAGAPFVLRLLPATLLLLLPFTAGSAALPDSCRQAQIDERAEVGHVFDGDTVRLSDGRRVRLIGINTPEMGHHDRQTEPLAEAARSSLQDTLQAHGNRLSLHYGEERKDRYGRLLAHGYLDNGEDVAIPLLRQGLATALVVPPNTLAASCYGEIEQQARSAGRGLWKLAAFQPVAADALGADTRGFRIVRGRVSAVTRTRHQLRIVLQGRLVASIANSDLANFEAAFLDRLPGQAVELRGWIKPRKKGFSVRIRHPAALTLLGNTLPH